MTDKNHNNGATREETLKEFEEAIIRDADRHGGEGAFLFGVMGKFRFRLPRTTMYYRVEMMAREDRIKIRDLGGRWLILPADKREEGRS